jgi:gluconate 2-dehydrogenase gamma chain
MNDPSSLARRRLIDRRSWLALVGVSAATSFACRSRSTSTDAGVGAVTSASHDASTVAPSEPPRVLAAAEAIALGALTGRILPSDDGPGAREANVVRFIDRQLQTPEIAPLAAAVRAIARILDKIDGKPFALLSVARQDEIAHRLAEGALTIDPPFPQREAFRLVHMLTLEGFLSDPIHGGNDGMVGWRSIAFSTPTLRAKGDHDGHHLHLPVVDSGHD